MKIKEYEDTSKNAFARKIQTTYEAKIDKSSANLVMNMLTKLYSEPHKAAIREYVSNAYDANVEAGATKPVEVHIPEQDEEWLSVRDYGHGLDYMGIVSVFANFGTSTKRDSDNLIGGFGIGSKSGLAISDAINITSVCNGILNEFVLERTPNSIITRFTHENQPTTDESGTTIMIKLGEKFKTDWDENLYVHMFNPKTVLCGWSKNEVLITNTKYEEFNEHRVPDTWYFNGYEYKCPLIQTNGQNLKGFLIGKVFYEMPATVRYKKSALESPSLIIPFDIKDIKVAYSRERIDYTDEDSNTRIVNAINDANMRTQDEYASIVKETSLQTYEKIRKLGNMGINPSYISASTLKVTGIIDKKLDEPAVFVKTQIDKGTPKGQTSISTNKVLIDTDAEVFLTFDDELPKRPLLKQFISWLQTNFDDTFKAIKEELNRIHYGPIVVTTTKGYAKMYYTNNTTRFNVQAAYNAFVTKNNKAVVDLSHHEFTYYDPWYNKGKDLIDKQWLLDKKVVIVHPKAGFTNHKKIIEIISKLFVENPKVPWNDVWAVITKSKKEYDYLTNLSPNTPTVSYDDICDMKTTIDKWTNNSGPNPIVTANLFKNLMLNSDKNLDNDLWLKTPFANQRFVERKICTIVNCYNDWLRYANKDLTTKAYYAYAEKQATKMDATEAQDIIEYISKTCAPEIVELNNMMDDLDTFIK